MIKYLKTEWGYRRLSFFSRVLHTWDNDRTTCYLALGRCVALLALVMLGFKW